MQKRRNSSFNTLELRLFCIKSSILYHLGTQNYALFRPAFQSSTWEGSVAPKAVDGNAMDDTSCAITYDADYNPGGRCCWPTRFGWHTWKSPTDKLQVDCIGAYQLHIYHSIRSTQTCPLRHKNVWLHTKMSGLTKNCVIWHKNAWFGTALLCSTQNALPSSQQSPPPATNTPFLQLFPQF